MDRQPGHLTPARGDASPAGFPRRATPRWTPTPHRAAAFTLIEILIVVVILGILAAIVVPQFSNASQVARENMLKDELRYFRTQISVYKAQHGDVPPGYLDGNASGRINLQVFKDQLTSRTNARGQKGTDVKLFPFGPYLQRIPPNPITGATGIMVLERGVELPPPSQITVPDEKAYGWIYRPDKPEINPCTGQSDARGRPYLNY
jgi:general secretion pathway protein G